MRILHDTFLIPALHAREFCKALALPSLVVVAFTFGWQLTRGRLPATVGWALYAVYVATFTVLAVNCHRLVLLGPSPETLIPKLRWGLRETKFLGWLAVLAVILIVARLLSILVLSNVLLLTFFQGAGTNVQGPGVAGSGWLRAPDYIAFAISVYVVARLSVVLPATAIGNTASLRTAWLLSARNGWRLVLIVGAVPWMLSRGLNLMYRQDATFPELALLVWADLSVSVRISEWFCDNLRIIFVDDVPEAIFAQYLHHVAIGFQHMLYLVHSGNMLEGIVS